MKKTAHLPAIAAAIALAYPAAAWYMGKQLEAHLDEAYRTVAEQTMVKIVERKFSRGVFSSDETVTLAFPGIPLSQAQADNETGSKMLHINFQPHYRHGPLPGLSRFAKASFSSELIVPADLQASVREFFGDQKPLLLTGHYAFDGSSRLNIDSPAVTQKFMPEKFGSLATLEWQGFSGQIESHSKLTESTFNFSLPGLALKEGNDVPLAISGIRIEGTQHKLLENEPLLQGGTTTLSIDEINISATGKTTPMPFAFKIKQASEKSSVELKGEHIDLNLEFAATTLQINNQNYAPAILRCAWRHIHARPLAQLYRQFVEFSAQPTDTPPATRGQLLIEKIKQPLLAILAENPQFAIDQLSFQTADGPFKLSAEAKLKQLEGNDLENPNAWAKALVAEAQISIPRSLAQTQAPPERIDSLIAQGLLTPAGNMLSSQGKLNQEGLYINGNKLGPNPLIKQAPAPEAE
ncbi:MAG: YdgA family protein [Rhodocyclales bacterium]|nr:YdgA family protein [Rhodocyclales bacterium]